VWPRVTQGYPAAVTGTQQCTNTTWSVDPISSGRLPATKAQPAGPTACLNTGGVPGSIFHELCGPLLYNAPVGEADSQVLTIHTVLWLLPTHPLPTASLSQVSAAPQNLAHAVPAVYIPRRALCMASQQCTKSGITSAAADAAMQQPAACTSGTQYSLGLVARAAHRPSPSAAPGMTQGNASWQGVMTACAPTVQVPTCSAVNW
jgi:hypothetical protein